MGKKQKAAASSKKSTRKVLAVTVTKRFYQVRWLIPMSKGQLNVFTYQSMTHWKLSDKWMIFEKDIYNILLIFIKIMEVSLVEWSAKKSLVPDDVSSWIITEVNNKNKMWRTDTLFRRHYVFGYLCRMNEFIIQSLIMELTWRRALFKKTKKNAAAK